MYRHIMVTLDGSELAECVLPHAEAVAVGCNVSKVTLVRVVEPLHIAGGLETRFPPEERQRLEADSTNIARDYLAQKVQLLKDKGIKAQAEVLHGHAANQLIDYANNNGVDLIVISTHGHSGVSHWVRGSVAERILHSSCVPVLMVRAPGCVAGI